jgi:hypothetical protein
LDFFSIHICFLHKVNIFWTFIKFIVILVEYGIFNLDNIL